MLHSLHQENSTLGASIMFIPAQLIIVGPVLLLFWFGGLRRLLRHPFGGRSALAYISSWSSTSLTGAKPYYFGGIYFVLFAAGGLVDRERLATTHRSARAIPYGCSWIARRLVAAAIDPAGPARDRAGRRGPGKATSTRTSARPSDGSAFVAPARRRRRSLPPSASAPHLVIFTGDYGAAGAVDLYGKRYGLPHAISGHNSYWWWGPSGAADGATTIAVNLPRSLSRDDLRAGRPGRIPSTRGHGIWTEERGDPIWICRHQKLTWAQAWPAAGTTGQSTPCVRGPSPLPALTGRFATDRDGLGAKSPSTALLQRRTRCRRVSRWARHRFACRGQG